MALSHKFTIFFVFTIVYLAKAQYERKKITTFDFKPNLETSKESQEIKKPHMYINHVNPPVDPPIDPHIYPLPDRPTVFLQNPCVHHSHVFSFSNVGLQKIGRDFISSNDIISLSLDNNDISDISPFAFRKMQNLKYLDLSGNKIPKEKLLSLARNTNLQTLIIDNNRDFHNPVTETLKEYEIFSNLKYLHLSNSQLHNFEVHFYIATPTLTHLYLNNNNITSSDIIFDNIPATLTHLYLNKNFIDRVKEEKLRYKNYFLFN